MKSFVGSYNLRIEEEKETQFRQAWYVQPFLKFLSVLEENFPRVMPGGPQAPGMLLNMYSGKLGMPPFLGQMGALPGAQGDISSAAAQALMQARAAAGMTSLPPGLPAGMMFNPAMFANFSGKPPGAPGTGLASSAGVTGTPSASAVSGVTSPVASGAAAGLYLLTTQAYFIRPSKGLQPKRIYSCY